MKIYKSKKGAREFKDGKEVKEIKKPKMMLKKKRGKGIAGSMADIARERREETLGANMKSLINAKKKKKTTY